MRSTRTWKIAGEAEDGEHGLALIALVDVHMPGVSGIEVTERVRKSKLDTRILILTMVEEAPFPKRLLEAGASGYLTKGCPAEELVKAVRKVADGQRYLGGDIAQQLALATMDGDASPFEELSARELEVAMMLAQGRAAKHIAAHLHLSEKTVATYNARLFEKHGNYNVVAQAQLGRAPGLLQKAVVIPA